MNWIPVCKKLPEKEGIYLCELESHYGIFYYENGKFQPNDWNQCTGMNNKSTYVGEENCILFWTYLPDFE
jgi:hypothetical protein